MPQVLENFFYDQLTKEDEDNIKKFQYRGGDLSFYYRFFLRPIANFLVQNEIIPKWVAPNIITLTGFCIGLIPHLLILYYAPCSPNVSIPVFVLMLKIICTTIYQILDNADGIQARTRNASSVLGMLLDHNCDIVWAGLTTLDLYAILRLQHPIYMISTLLHVLLAFIGHLLLENYEDGLFLGYINGPNEGVLFLMISIAASIYLGDSWFGNIYEGKTITEWYAVLTELVCLGLILMVIYRCVKAASFFQVFKDSLVMMFINFCCFGANKLAPNFIYENWRLYGYVVVFTCAKLAGYYQISHACHSKIKQYHKSLAVSAIFIPVTTYLASIGKEREAIAILWCLFIFTMLSYAHFILSIKNQLVRILDIEVFRIKPKKDQNKNQH